MASDAPDTLRPGRPVRGSTTGRPIMALFSLIGRRWTLRVIREPEQAGKPLTFRELHTACGYLSSSVVTTTTDPAGPLQGTIARRYLD